MIKLYLEKYVSVVTKILLYTSIDGKQVKKGTVPRDLFSS